MLIVGLSLFGLVVYAQLPMNRLDVFYSANGVYAATMNPTHATVQQNQSQIFAITVSPDSDSITYVWRMDNNVIPITGSSCFLFDQALGNHIINCEVTVSGNVINCNSILSVTSNGYPTPTPTATPILDNVANLFSLAPLYRDIVVVLSLLLAGFGTVNILLSKRY
jgi:hypothetical protein